MAILSGRVTELRSLTRPDAMIRRKQMNPSTKDEIKGNFHEVKGTVKEKAGQVTNRRVSTTLRHKCTEFIEF
jgi:hypothetical protein